MRPGILGKQLWAAFTGPCKLFEYSLYSFCTVPQEEADRAWAPLTERRHSRIGNLFERNETSSHQAFSKEFAESIGDGALIKSKKSLASASERKDDLRDQKKYCQNPRTERAVEFY